MTFSYSTRDLAETMAQRLAGDSHAAFAVFDDRRMSGDHYASICPLDELGRNAADLLVIYEPQS